MTKEQEYFYKGYSIGLEVLENEVSSTAYSQEEIPMLKYFIDGVINALHSQRQKLSDFKEEQ